jgi:hypothetical protein
MGRRSPGAQVPWIGSSGPAETAQGGAWFVRTRSTARRRCWWPRWAGDLAKAIPGAAPRKGLDVRVSVLPQQDRTTTHGLYEVTLSQESRIVWRSLADDM